jgi:hypothetical protein
MKLFILLALGMIGLSATAQESVEKLTSSYPVQMDSYIIARSDVSAIEVRVNYKMVKVDCHGLAKEYSYTKNAQTGEVFVSAQTMAFTANMCPPFSGKQAQDGIKFNLKAESGQSIYVKLLVPAGSTVEIVKNPASSSAYVCKATVDCMPPLMSKEAQAYCSQEYMDWAATNCAELPVQLM